MFEDETLTLDPFAGLFDVAPLPQETDDGRRLRTQRLTGRGQTVHDRFARVQPARRAREEDDDDEGAVRDPVRRQRVTGPTHIDLNNVVRSETVSQRRPARVRVRIANSNQATPIHAHPQPRRRRTSPGNQQRGQARPSQAPIQPRVRRARLMLQQIQMDEDREHATRLAAEEEARRRESQWLEAEHERLLRRAAERQSQIEAAERSLAMTQEIALRAERMHIEAQQAYARARQAHEAAMSDLARIEAHPRGRHAPLDMSTPRFVPRDPSLDFTFRFPSSANQQALRFPGTEQNPFQPNPIEMQHHSPIDARDLDDTLTRLRQAVDFSHPNLPGV